MQNIDFSRIRAHGGSQNKGFEELVCQLAHLSKPDNAKYFVRKDGAGGDAGVECYWKLNDGSEHAWQAKYFMGSLKATQWRQITESVKSALDKHPELTKYYVCLPIDRSDSRRKDSITQMDKWETNVREWEEIAKEKSMQVEFCYWGQHEISLMLQRDTDDFAGRAMYWFGGPILTIGIFKELARKSESALVGRYTPEQHIDLPITHKFEALGNTESWWKRLAEHVKSWTDASSQFGKPLVKALEGLNCPEYHNIRTSIDAISNSLRAGLAEGSFMDGIGGYIKESDALSSYLIDMSSRLSSLEKLLATKRTPDAIRAFQHNFYTFRTGVEVLVEFLKGASCKLAQQKKALLTGEAGIGKSHLLCDIALSRLNKGLPTVFVLGQHYRGGDPLDTLNHALDLNNVSYRELLGALDAAGEAHKTNTLIIIDAINEGSRSDDWRDYLTTVLDEVSKFRHISIVLSCRTTYVDYLVPNEIVGKSIIEIKHHGFSGFEYQAASQYLDKQGIAKPSAPILSPEFTNPLFLKTCCKAMREREMTEFPKGMQGISSLMDFYLDSVERQVEKKKRYRPGEDVVHKALIAFASKLYPDNQHGLPVDCAVELVNSFDTRQNVSESLFNILIHENVLAEDMDYMNIESGDGIRSRRVIRFTYERFSDQFIANSLIEGIGSEEITRESIRKGKFSPLMSQEYYKYAGILSALGIIVAEKFGIEIVDLLPDGMSDDDGLLKRVFMDTLQWRSAESFSVRTLEILNEIDSYEFDSPVLEAFLKVSTEPEHPWNAERLHKELMKKKMPERDAFWSIYIALHDYEEDKGNEESIVRSLINWGYSGTLDNVDSERVRLCSIVLIWMTSSSNRKVRDQATKSAIRLLAAYPHLLAPVLKKFDDADDLYVRERLYAIAYGVVTNVDDKQILEEISNLVWEKIFSGKRPTPHILLRDYARGIMEYSLHKGVLDEGINPDSFRPPYQSEWPLDDPSKQEIDSLIGEGPSAIQSSVMGILGDFGKYTMGCVHDWSPTPISHKAPQTAHELQIAFANSIEGNLKDRLLSLLDERDRLNDESLSQKYDALKKDIKDSLDSDKQEAFRWVMGLGSADSLGAFSRKKAQRWVCKRAIEIGWSKDLFEVFEGYYIDYGRQVDNTIERIGKKYQWIALYEFLAYLADNCIYKGWGYASIDYLHFDGPWQILKRDLDPTYWIRSTGDDDRYEWKEEYWWQPFVYPFSGVSIEELQTWLLNKEIAIPFEELLQVTDGESNRWLILETAVRWGKEPEKGKEEIPCQNVSCHINSCIVRKSDVAGLVNFMERKSPWLNNAVEPDQSTSQGFIREYPWHPVYKDMGGWNIDFEDSGNARHNTKGLPTTFLYAWNSEEFDKSINQSIWVHLPSKEIIEGLNLYHDLAKLGCWKNARDEAIFFDPSVEGKGPSSALCRTSYLFEWLEDNDLQLIWFVSGAKRLYTDFRAGIETKSFGSLYYRGIYKLTQNNNIAGKIWFPDERKQNQ